MKEPSRLTVKSLYMEPRTWAYVESPRHNNGREPVVLSRQARFAAWSYSANL
jgi:hypothetical protein